MPRYLNDRTCRLIGRSLLDNEKPGRMHDTSATDGWAGAVMQKPLAVQKCDGRGDRPTRQGVELLVRDQKSKSFLAILNMVVSRDSEKKNIPLALDWNLDPFRTEPLFGRGVAALMEALSVHWSIRWSVGYPARVEK